MPELLKVLQVISECDALILKKIPSILALTRNWQTTAANDLF